MAPKSDDLFVLNLEVTNFLRIGAIKITPRGPGVIQITGNNKQGKTSTLKAIWAAVGGAALTPEQPIGKNGDIATIRMVLGSDPKHPEFMINKRFTLKPDGEEIIVDLELTDGRGFKARRPHETMKSWLQSITVDPMAFLDAPPKQQAEILRQIAGLDTVAVDIKRKAAFQERTIANREVASAQARLAAAPETRTPPKRVDVTKTLEQLAEAQKAKDQQRERDTAIADAERDVAHFQARVGSLTLRVAELEKTLRQANEQLAEAQEAEGLSQRDLERLQKQAPIALPDITALNNKLAEADKTNRQHEAIKAANATRNALERELQEAERRAEALTATIVECDAQRAELIAACKMPLKGLSIDPEGNVTFSSKTKKDAPLADASGAERIEVAVSVAMAQNPRLRVIHINHGNDIDDASWQVIEDIARKRKMQIWIETVRQVGDAAIRIVDGHLADEKGQAA